MKKVWNHFFKSTVLKKHQQICYVSNISISKMYVIYVVDNTRSMVIIYHYVFSDFSYDEREFLGLKLFLLVRLCNVILIM